MFGTIEKLPAFTDDFGRIIRRRRVGRARSSGTRDAKQEGDGRRDPPPGNRPLDLSTQDGWLAARSLRR